ncbi:BMC domain-containing protein [Ignavigranum ruoffiae]
MIQEYVPGKQLTIAHLIANPDDELFGKMGIVGFEKSAIGIATITPSEAIIIAVDIATKNAEVEIGFLDRFSGSMIIVGTFSSVKSALEVMIKTLKEEMDFDVVEVSVT